MDPWAVLGDDQRLEWPFVPFERVGPLEFGMTHAEMEEAVAGTLSVVTIRKYDPDPVAVEASLSRERPWPLGPEPNAVVYFGESGGLAGVAIDARCGPQVRLGALALVGQVPSRLEAQFTEYLDQRGMGVRFSQRWDPSSDRLGVVLRPQRAGDRVLSRPVLVAREWAERCGDTSEGPIPEHEWNYF